MDVKQYSLSLNSFFCDLGQFRGLQVASNESQSSDSVKSRAWVRSRILEIGDRIIRTPPDMGRLNQKHNVAEPEGCVKWSLSSREA